MRENRRFAKHGTEAMHSFGLFDSVMQFLSVLLYLVIILVGGLFLVYGRIDGGEFAAFVLYISMFLNPIQRFVALFEQLQEGAASYASRIFLTSPRSPTGAEQ